MLKATVLLIVIALCSSLEISSDVQAIPWPFTICGTGNWKIQKLTFGSQPARGQNDDIILTGTATNSVQFKKCVLTVKLDGAYLDTQNIPFESSYDDGDIVQFKYKNFVPSFAPFGTYSLTFNFQNSNGGAQGCLQTSFKL